LSANYYGGWQRLAANLELKPSGENAVKEENTACSYDIHSEVEK
jgi:hypothetical protein